jgi:hypothetical protein
MGLGKDNISTWEEMKKAFLKKYHDYYKDKEKRGNLQDDAERG